MSLLRMALITAISLLLAPLAWAQYPSKPVKLIVSAAPGSSPDLTARLLAQKLSAVWSQPVVVEDIAGAGGNLAAERVAKSASDGYTVLYASAGVLYFNKSLYQIGRAHV